MTTNEPSRNSQRDEGRGVLADLTADGAAKELIKVQLLMRLMGYDVWNVLGQSADSVYVSCYHLSRIRGTYRAMSSIRRFGIPLAGYEGVARVTVEERDTKTERSGCFEAAQFPSGRTAVSFVPTELPRPTRISLRDDPEAEISFHGTDADGWTITFSGETYYSRLSWMFAPITGQATEVSLGAQYMEARREGAREDGYGRMRFVVSNLLWHDASDDEPEPIELSVQDFEVTVVPIDDYAEIAQRLAGTHGVEPTALVCIQAPPGREVPLQV